MRRGGHDVGLIDPDGLAEEDLGQALAIAEAAHPDVAIDDARAPLGASERPEARLERRGVTVVATS